MHTSQHDAAQLKAEFQSAKLDRFGMLDIEVRPAPQTYVDAQPKPATASEDPSHWRLLLPLLEIAKPFADGHIQWDAKSLSLQKQHAWIVCLAAFSGAVAVVLAIVQLGTDIEYLWVIEGVLSVFLLGIVLWGIWNSLDNRWRLERFRAEQSRHAKIRFLMNALAGNWDTEAQRGYVAQAMHELSSLPRFPADYPQPGGLLGNAPGMREREWLKRWVRRSDQLLHEAPPIAPDDLTADELASMKAYYIAKRIDRQSDYFLYKANQHQYWEECTRHWAPRFFFASVIAAVLHLFVDAVGLAFDEHSHVRHSLHMFAEALLFVAAIAPVLGLLLRTIRGAFEFGRHEIRYLAMHNYLEQARQRVAAASTARDAWALMEQVENEIAGEHRAWMRLMLEAEWYG